MYIVIKSKVFVLRLKYNKTAIITALMVLFAILLLFAFSTTATSFLVTLAIFIGYLAAVAAILFSGLTVTTEKEEITEKTKSKKTQSTTTATKAQSTATTEQPKPKKREAPIPKLDIPVPEKPEEKTIPKAPPRPESGSEPEPQPVTAVPDWRKLLAGKD